MRNSFGFDNAGANGFGAEFDPDALERAASTDQIAVVLGGGSDVVVASPFANGSRGSFSTDVARFTSDFGLATAINARRVGKLGLPPLSQATRFLTTVNDYSERTRILALDGQRLALDDDDLLEWLINAEKEMILGTDGHPVFETPFEDTACSIRRLPNGQISVTEVQRQQIQSLRQRIRSLANESRSSYLQLTVETPLRCAARYFLTITKEGKETLRPGKGSEVTAFILVSRTGYSFGLWSPQTGLFTEYAFLAPDEVSRSSAAKSPAAMSPVAIVESAGVGEYVKQAFNELIRQMSPEKLENLQLTSFAQVVWAVETSLSSVAAPIAAENSTKTGLDFIALNVPADEAVATGLLLGSHSFGDAEVVGARNLPTVDLAHDILALADSEEIERTREDEARRLRRRNQAVFTMMAAPVIVLACLVALAGSLVGSYFLTAIRDARADAKTQELKPALERRRSYEANLKWYQEFVTEVSQLRRQQPVGIGLLYQLNANYPFNIDPTFYVTDLKLSPTGDVEMKGMARSKDAVAAFLKELEFASGPESGSRLFKNLAYEIQEMAPAAATANQVKLPTMAGSTLSSAKATAPGVIQWSIKGNYLPVADFAPKPESANKPGAPANPGAPPPAANVSKP